MARQTGRAASAGGHHGGPHWATRRSHPDSPESGAAPTLRPVTAQMTVTKRISDALFPRGFEVASPPGVFSRHGSLPRAYADQCIHAGRSFFFPHQKGFFSAAAEQQQMAKKDASSSPKSGKCTQLMETRHSSIRGTSSLRSKSQRLGSSRTPARSSKRDKYSQEASKNRFRTCRFAVF